jgi:hypothetical protein
MWYNNPDIFLAIHKSRLDAVSVSERRSLKLIKNAK